MNLKDSDTNYIIFKKYIKYKNKYQLSKVSYGGSEISNPDDNRRKGPLNVLDALINSKKSWIDNDEKLTQMIKVFEEEKKNLISLYEEKLKYVHDNSLLQEQEKKVSSDISEFKQKIEKKKDEIDTVKSSIEKKNSEIVLLEDELKDLEDKLKDLEDELKDLEGELKGLEDKLKGLEGELEGLKDEYKDILPILLKKKQIFKEETSNTSEDIKAKIETIKEMMI